MKDLSDMRKKVEEFLKAEDYKPDQRSDALLKAYKDVLGKGAWPGETASFIEVFNQAWDTKYLQ